MSIGTSSSADCTWTRELGLVQMQKRKAAAAVLSAALSGSERHVQVQGIYVGVHEKQPCRSRLI
jgi:hypothetical protein